MKRHRPLLHAIAAGLLLVSPLAAQETSEGKRFALVTPEGKYVSTAESGGLNLGGKAATNRTVFVILDANGGDIADGDELKIKYYPGAATDPGKSKPSFWKEESDKITRVNKEPEDGSAKFTVKKQGEGFVLQTASGKFVAAPKGDGGLSLADSADGALLITFKEATE